MKTNQYKVLIGDDSTENGLAWANLLRQKGMYTMTRQRNGRVILDTLRHELPDVLIIDAKMPEYDAVALMAIITAELPKTPIIIVVSSYDSPQVEREVMDAGASYYMVHPFEPETLAGRVGNLLGGFVPSGVVEKVSTGSLEGIVTNYIRELGIPAHLLGYNYLRTAVMLSVDDNKFICDITGKLYPEVARLYASNPSRVERAIRHAVNYAHSNSGKRCPTNKELIATFVDDARLDMVQTVIQQRRVTA
jgi:two-component system response regulator (stage 0 sporulation protein A)